MIGNQHTAGRPVVRPDGMSPQEFNRRASLARNRAASRLQTMYAAEYHKMIDEERKEQGLPPSSHSKNAVLGIKSNSKVKAIYDAERYFVLAENSNVAQQWCRTVGLDFHSKKVYYVGYPNHLRKAKINLVTDRIVFIAGWRKNKSAKTGDEMEAELCRATNHHWAHIMASNSVLFIDMEKF